MQMVIVQLIRFAFWMCSGILLYVYVIYPVLIRALAACFGKSAIFDDRQPAVTVVVTAYNEEKSIRAKLDNLAELNYPPARADVLVVSDASSDATEQIAATYDARRVRVMRVEGRLGKTACQNAAAAVASGEILVFTDATTRVDP
ncbi:MAG TPA: glycosyltransferase, partial [Candidatus Acidoferrales bacterium]